MNRTESAIRNTPLRFPVRIWMLGVAACLLLCSHLQAADFELPGPVVPDGLGVNIHFTDPKPGEMKMIDDAGIRWVRMDFDWSVTEREKGVYNFAAYDRLMAALEPHNIRALFILDYDNRHYDGGVSPHTDEGRAAFAKWAVAAVRHFRGRGIIWEMWNEPEMIYMGNSLWTPKPNVHDYSALAVAVGKALRAAEPDELYIGPAAAIYASSFIEASFQLGVLEYFSAVSVHPYPLDDYASGVGPEMNFAQYAKLRRLIDKYAPKGKFIPIISSEHGYSSIRHMNKTEQGKLLPRQWLTNLANGVPLSIWYDWHDDGLDPKNPEHNFGIVHHSYLKNQSPVYEPKPAYLAAKTLTHTLKGYQFKERLAAGGENDYVMKFVKGKETILAAWTSEESSRTVDIPIPPGRYTAIGHTGKSLWTKAADARGLCVTLTDAPVYLVPEREKP